MSPKFSFHHLLYLLYTLWFTLDAPITCNIIVSCRAPPGGDTADFGPKGGWPREELFVISMTKKLRAKVKK